MTEQAFLIAEYIAQFQSFMPPASPMFFYCWQRTPGKSVRAKQNEDKNKTCERSVLKAYSTEQVLFFTQFCKAITLLHSPRHYLLYCISSTGIPSSTM